MSAQKQYDDLIQFNIDQLRVATGGKGILSHFTEDYSPSQPDFKLKLLASLKLIVTTQKNLSAFIQNSTTGMIPYSRPVIEQCLAQMILIENQVQQAASLYLNYDWFTERLSETFQLTTTAIKTADSTHHTAYNAHGRELVADPYDLDAAVAHRPG